MDRQTLPMLAGKYAEEKEQLAPEIQQVMKENLKEYKRETVKNRKVIATSSATTVQQTFQSVKLQVF